MYIQNHDRFGKTPLPQCPPGTDIARGYKPPFDSAEWNITDKDAPKILAILCGPSPWQSYLRANLNAHLRDLPAHPIQIVSTATFTREYQKIFSDSISQDVMGFVDRGNAIIYLREFLVGRATSKLGVALHEAVHLFSHPAGRSNSSRASAYRFLDTGLLEGLTQIFTEDIQAAQGIQPLRTRLKAYQAYMLVAQEFLRVFTRTIVGDAYFKGQLRPLQEAISKRWGDGEFRKLVVLINKEKTTEALGLIQTLEKKHLAQQLHKILHPLPIRR